MRVGYVVKRYPRYSETFIVNEILAHEATGLDLEIFALRTGNDTHFQDSISRVKAPVTYLDNGSGKAEALWSALRAAEQRAPGLVARLAGVLDEDVREVSQGLDLAEKVAARGVTHLHAHFATSATTVARIASRISRVPYTFTGHAKDLFHDSVVAEDLRRKLADAAAVVTVSDFNVTHLRERYGSAARHVERIYNGLPLERFGYHAATERPPRVLAVGRLVEKKGFEYLVDACAILRDRGIAHECRIVGSGELEDALHARIDARGVRGCVDLLGSLPQRRVIEEIQVAAALAVPCVLGSDGNRDGLPTVLPEAMALGTPCVSTDVTGIPEILKHDQTGLMVPQRDPEALADALQRLLSSPDLRVRLARQARRRVESDYDIRLNTARLRELFQAGMRVREVRRAS